MHADLPHIPLQKREKLEESTSLQAASSCIKVIEGYWLRLGTNPNLRLGEYCMETHTNYRGVNYWAKCPRFCHFFGHQAEWLDIFVESCVLALFNRQLSISVGYPPMFRLQYTSSQTRW